MANGRYVLVDEEFQFEVLNRLNQLSQLINGTKTSQPGKKSEDLMDTADTMSYLKVTRRTLHKYRTRMGLPSKKMENGKIYYWRHQIDKFLNKNNQ